MQTIKSTITITMGDVAENHVGMEQLGKLSDVGTGFNLNDLQTIKINMEAIGAKCNIVTLKAPDNTVEDAYVLVIKNGVDKILKKEGTYTKTDMFNEQLKLDFDKKALMKGKVVNKHARWNVCYDKKSRDPDYESGKGRIIGYKKIPITSILIKNLEKYFGSKAKDLKGEGNYYYDISKTGIGYHSDLERRKVIGIRLGSDMPLYFKWYKNSEPCGDRVEIPLKGGDIYVMSEKAVGTDGRRRTIPILRHAAGADKYSA